MKAWMLLPVGAAGAALVAYGLTRAAPKPKAMEPLGAPPEDPKLLPQQDPSAVPTHTQTPDPQERASASYCQLLTAYREDLRRYKTQADEAFLRMQDALREAEGVCKDFAWNATWNYQYAGLFGANGWTEFHKEASTALLTRCQEYVKGTAKDPGKPSIPKPPSKGAYWYDGTYTDVASKINALKQQVEDARAALPALSQKYAKAKADYDRAQAKVADLKKKIADLEAQGVFC